MIPLVYHDAYDLNIGKHVFPSRKYRLIKERLGMPVLTPKPASDADILRVHTKGLRDGALRAGEIHPLEIPWSAETAKAFWLAAGAALKR